MALMKYAAAQVEQSSVEADDWNSLKKKASTSPASGFTKNASDVDLSKYSPDQYMLSHCTIIASVDTEEPPGEVKTGSSVKTASGKEVNRPYKDYRITEDTEKYINQNGDSWERELLLETYDTFVGAENYVEHVQVPELSKGKVIDAVARDLGDTVYIDILVATNKKHQSLVRDIKKGKINTLSMGCFVPGTPVTMSSGASKPIEKVRPGDEVYTHEGDVKEVKNVQKKTWDEDLVEIETPHSNDPLVTTHNHPFLTVRPQEKCACGCGEDVSFRDDKVSRKRLKGRFKRGHDKRVLNPNANYSDKELSERESKLEEINGVDTEWVEAGDLKENDWLVFPESSVEEEPDDVSLRDARLMGYYLAEGNVCKNPSGDVYAVEFTFGSHENTLVREVEDLLTQKGLQYSVYDRPDKNTLTVRVHDSDYAEFLRDKCSHYASEKEIQVENLLLWPSDYKKRLIGAYFNGDGTVEETGSISATTVSYQLHQQIRSLLRSIGVSTSEWSSTVDEKIPLHEAEKIGRQKNNRLPAYKISVCKSQRQQLQDYTKWDTPLDVRERSQDNVDGLVLMPVESVLTVPCQEDYVYDFEVEGDHSYIVDGYAVHNCSISYSLCTKCGNKASDETDLCEHVKYMKGNTFTDKEGNEREIAEICGHRDDPQSVKFIEASWVIDPAFDGAVLRNVLGEDEKREYDESTSESGDNLAQMIDQAHDISLSHRNQSPGSSMDSFLKSAHYDASSDLISDLEDDSKTAQWGDEEEEDEGDEDKDPLDKAVDEIKEQIGAEVAEDLKDRIDDSGDMGETDWDSVPQKEDLNENILHGYNVFADRYSSEFGDSKRLSRTFLVLHRANNQGWGNVKNASDVSNRDIISAMYIRDRDYEGQALPPEIYNCLNKVGGASNYNNLDSFLNSCELALNRKLSSGEKRVLVRRAKLLK